MRDTTRGQQLRETAKLRVRDALSRANLDLRRGPYPARLVQALQHAGVEGVLDIGANVGQFAASLRSAGFSGRIVSVEPLPDAGAALEKRAAKDPAWDVVHGGVGTDASATINVAANSYSSSILPIAQTHIDAAPGSTTTGEVEVPLSSVVELVARYSLRPETTLLKIDTQGYERTVIDSAADLIDRFAAVQLEMSLVELYRGQALAPDLDRIVRDAGLTLWSLEPGFSDQHGRLMQYDALYLRHA